MWAKTFPDDDVEVFMLAQGPEPVTCAKGLRVIPDHTWDTAPEFDVLVYPGGEGNIPQVGRRGDQVLAPEGIGAGRADDERVLRRAGVRSSRLARRQARDDALVGPPDAPVDGQGHRGPAGRSVRRRRSGHHRGGRVSRDRHGAPPGRAAALGRARERGQALHPVRPAAARLTSVLSRWPLHFVQRPSSSQVVCTISTLHGA